MSLADQECIPCRGGVPPLPNERVEELLLELGSAWSLNGAGHLERDFDFPDFARAMVYANQLAELAEAQAHHPDLHIAWGKCRVEIWTHKIDGLTESDFVFGAKAERLFARS